MIDEFEFECPWCGSTIDSGQLEQDIWKEGGYDVECPACGMRLAVDTERPVVLHVAVFFDEMRPCIEGGCGFYGAGRCEAGSLGASLGLPEGVPAWCPRLKGGRK